MTLPQMPALATVDDVRRELSGNPVLATSKGRSWNGIAVDEFTSYRVADMEVGPRDHHVLSVNLSDHPYVRSQRCGRSFESAGRVGEAMILPSGIASTWDGTFPAHISLRFSPTRSSKWLLKFVAEDIRVRKS